MKRIYGLDFYRLIAIFMIFLFHSRIHIGCSYSIFNLFIGDGAIFMVAFFIISGFSLYYAYKNRISLQISNLKEFYTKRIISIYPLYILTVLYILFFRNTLTIKQNILIFPIHLMLLQSPLDGSFAVGSNQF